MKRPGDPPPIDSPANIVDWWLSFECVNGATCPQLKPGRGGVVLDVRVSLAPMDRANEVVELPCPICKKPMHFRGRWEASSTGHGSRGDMDLAPQPRIAKALERLVELVGDHAAKGDPYAKLPTDARGGPLMPAPRWRKEGPRETESLLWFRGRNMANHTDVPLALVHHEKTDGKWRVRFPGAAYSWWPTDLVGEWCPILEPMEL